MALEKMSGCQSVYGKDDEVLFLGEWDPKAVLNVLSPDTGYWNGKRVLDIGANTLGLSVEIAKCGGIVTAIEPDRHNKLLRRTEGLVRQMNLEIDVLKVGFLQSARIASFDVVLCLGMVFHFRDIQYCLDYLSTIEHEKLFISAQTQPGTELAMFNRRDPAVVRQGILPENVILDGWHPTRPLFERMLMWAGFADICSLTDEEYNFPKKQAGLTSSAYYSALRSFAVDPIRARAEFCSY